MESWEHIHWFITSRCNLSCSYCFKPIEKTGEEPGRLEQLANLLVSNKVRKVTLGGGEPTLVKHLEPVLRILKGAGIYVSIHTNGLTLNTKSIRQLSGLVDDIALPLDTLNRKNQQVLRGKPFMHTFDNKRELAEQILSNGIGLGYHTVFTQLNYRSMPGVYRFIKGIGFDYWKIYEFNSDLVQGNFIESKQGRDLSQKEVDRWRLIERLQGKPRPETGQTDSLLARFLLAEEAMPVNDKRIQFVGVRDYSRPTYAFLDNDGNVRYYAYFSGRKRKALGNILQDDSFIKKKLGTIHQRIIDHPLTFDDESEDEWLEAKLDTPVFVRYYDGDYEIEEIECIKPGYISLFERVESLYRARQERMDR
jgi:MoaA/NifB/PqqE/SkfB family radical SAM enzyme